VRSQALLTHTLSRKHWRSVCLSLHSKPKSMKHQKTKNKKTKPRERREKNKNKTVCCDTYYVPEMIFLSRSLWLWAVYQSWNEQWLLKLSVCTQSSPVLQCSWHIYLSNKERRITYLTNGSIITSIIIQCFCLGIFFWSQSGDHVLQKCEKTRVYGLLGRFSQKSGYETKS
jgi:hypothetical protein